MKTCKNKSIEELKDICKDLQDKLNQVQSFTINNINTINNNIVVTAGLNKDLKNFGFENMDALPVSLVRDLFMDLKFRDLLENLHCDPDYPENHNIRIKSIKRNVMEVYRNDKWDIVSFVNGLNELLLQGHRIFKHFYKKNKEVVLEDMSEQELSEILCNLDDIENMNKSALKPLHEELQFMLESFKHKTNNEVNVNLCNQTDLSHVIL
jgi:hypothetical protein